MGLFSGKQLLFIPGLGTLADFSDHFIRLFYVFVFFFFPVLLFW